jgi:hypothetical protein
MEVVETKAAEKQTLATFCHAHNLDVRSIVLASNEELDELCKEYGIGLVDRLNLRRELEERHGTSTAGKSFSMWCYSINRCSLCYSF